MRSRLASYTFRSGSLTRVRQRRSYSSTTMATPVVMCGLSEKMGGRMAPRLKPEYEVVQFITSIARAKSEISALQAGNAPTPDPDNVGSHDFSKRPVAVLFGRGFEEDAVKDIREHCGGEKSGLAWLQSTKEAKEQVKKEFNSGEEALDFYADHTSKAAKGALEDLKKEGKLGVDGIHFYGW